MRLTAQQIQAIKTMVREQAGADAIARLFGSRLDDAGAERLRLIGDAQAWFDVRKLRDQRVHEYIEDPAVLAPTLRAGPDFIPALAAAAAKL